MGLSDIFIHENRNWLANKGLEAEPEYCFHRLVRRRDPVFQVDANDRISRTVNGIAMLRFVEFKLRLNSLAFCYFNAQLFRSQLDQFFLTVIESLNLDELPGPFSHIHQCAAHRCLTTILEKRPNTPLHPANASVRAENAALDGALLIGLPCNVKPAVHRIPLIRVNDLEERRPEWRRAGPV
ncbi:MAG: hypothetical protein ABJ256_22885 [Nisaea sp.]|uniref:hypothetical protein n=1 Tax=Nisaea sp. TaxID=2024842 RepID=UPI0032665B6E